MKEIKIFSDYACPFCYIGLAIAMKLKEEVEDLKIEFVPFLLSPDLPLEGGDLRDSLDEKVIENGYKRIERLGREYGLVYKNKNKKFNTNRLHRAGLYAQSQGKGLEFSLLAYKYIFEYGKNVGDPLIINEIALVLELDTLEMNTEIDKGSFEAEMAEADRLKDVYEINSVPTFIINGEKKVTGLKAYEKLKEDLLG